MLLMFHFCFSRLFFMASVLLRATRLQLMHALDAPLKQEESSIVAVVSDMYVLI